MKPYPAYRPTGLPWLPQIPAHWEQRKVGKLFRERWEKVADTDYSPLSVTKDGIVPQLENAAKTDAGDNRKRVCPGDFVINSRSDRKGSCGVSNLSGSVSLVNLVLEPCGALTSSYVHYLLRCHAFSEEFYRNGHGIVADLWTTRYSEMKTIGLPVPPREEQDRIVRFLDKRVAQIDQLIEIREEEKKLIADDMVSTVCLSVFGNHHSGELKQSEVFWVGNIPKAWRETKLRYVLEKQNRPIPAGAELLICSNHGEVKKRGESKLGLVAASTDVYQGVQQGDLLIHGMDTWHGAIAISDYDGMCTPVVHVCTCKQSKRFVAYYLRALAYKGVYKAISNGVRQNTSDFRSWDAVANISIALPSYEEQEQIADLLDTVTSRAKRLIHNYEQQQIRLQELKARLISDVVTGAVDVRGKEA